MISRLQSSEENENDNIECFGVGYTDHVNDKQCHPGITGQRRVSFKPLGGLLTQQKLTPMEQNMEVTLLLTLQKIPTLEAAPFLDSA